MFCSKSFVVFSVWSILELMAVTFLGPGGLSPGSTELGIHILAPDDLEPLLELLEDDDDDELELQLI